jgi:hypothetical protein
LPNGILAEMRQPHSREKSIVSEKRNKFLCFSSRLFVARRLRRLHLQELCACSAKLLALVRKNKRVCFVFLSFFRNFGRIRNLSLSKGSLGDGGKIGLRIRDRTIFVSIKTVGNDDVITCKIA